MNKRIEARELLNDALTDAASEEFRQSTLEQGLNLMRQKRARHSALQRAWVTMSLVGFAAMLLWPARETNTTSVSNRSVESPIVQASQPKVIAGTPIRIISDQELLDMFKDRPVALVGQSGHQRLLLLDEIPN